MDLTFRYRRHVERQYFFPRRRVQVVVVAAMRNNDRAIRRETRSRVYVVGFDGHVTSAGRSPGLQRSLKNRRRPMSVVVCAVRAFP